MIPLNTESGLHLVIVGNKNINTFANTLRIAATYWKKPSVNSIFLIRIKSINTKELPDWRSLSFNLLPDLSSYQEIVVSDVNGIATILPQHFRGLLIEQNISQDSIIVDLTNATKTWCDFIYLVCSLMQISNLFRVKAQKEVYDIPYGQVDIASLNVEMEPILKLDDLQRIARLTYSEYISYLKEVTAFIDWIKNESLMILESDRLYIELLKAFEYYMRGEYDSSIIKIAKVLEEILDAVIAVLEFKFGPHWLIVINKNLPRNSLGSKAQTLGQACTRINYLISGVSNNFTDSSEGQLLKQLDETYQFAPLVPTGTEFQSLALIRNYSGHGNHYNSVLQTDADARQMLKGTLFIFNKMIHCALLRRN